jgi:hypothetical protein
MVTNTFSKNEKIQYDTKANDNIRSLRKKILKKYRLSKEIVLIDKFLKLFLEFKKIKNISSAIFIIYYKQWNLKDLNQCTNLLVGGTRNINNFENMKKEIYKETSSRTTI